MKTKYYFEQFKLNYSTDMHTSVSTINISFITKFCRKKRLYLSSQAFKLWFQPSPSKQGHSAVLAGGTAHG